MALSSLSLSTWFRWLLFCVIWIGLSRLEGLDGGLLDGVEVLGGGEWLPSVLCEVLDSSARTLYLLLCLVLVQASLLSSGSIVMPGPEKFKWWL